MRARRGRIFEFEDVVIVPVSYLLPFQNIAIYPTGVKETKKEGKLLPVSIDGRGLLKTALDKEPIDALYFKVKQVKTNILPRGKDMQLSTYLQDDKVKALDDYAERMNMSRSQVLSLIVDYVLDNREALIDYLKQRVKKKGEDAPFAERVERVWETTRERAEKAGYSEKDVNRLIRDVRRKRASDAN